LIEVRCLHTLEEIAALREQIDALNLASARPDPFSTFEFYENYLRNEERFPRGKGLRPWFLVAFAAGRLVAYLALKQVAHRVMGLRALQIDWLTAHTADRPHLVAEVGYANEATEAFYAYLLERKREWSLLEFQQQDEASPLFPPPATPALEGCRVRHWPNMENGTIPVRWDTVHAYFKAFSKKFRSNVSRQIRTLFSAGEVECLMSSDPAITPYLFELYRIVESRSWKSTADAAIGRDPKWVEYTKGLLGARQPMHLSIHVLLLDGVPIAGLINGSFQKGLYALHMTYDQGLSRLAPGGAVLLMGMRQAIDGRFAFFDLLWGFGYYKTRWLAEMTETRSVQIYRKGGIFFWRRMLGDLKRRLPGRGTAQESALFNPASRDAIELQATPGAAPRLEMALGEKKRVATLVAKVRRGQGEFLSAAALASVMPFETHRIPWRLESSREHASRTDTLH
jgi:CelD/BcsL family acetyltransferase involved in cellulose biosynthesis